MEIHRFACLPAGQLLRCRDEPVSELCKLCALKILVNLAEPLSFCDVHRRREISEPLTYYYFVDNFQLVRAKLLAALQEILREYICMTRVHMNIGAQNKIAPTQMLLAKIIEYFNAINIF